MSSRASVDYLIPLIRRINAENLTTEQRENLAKREHLDGAHFIIHSVLMSWTNQNLQRA